MAKTTTPTVGNITVNAGTFSRYQRTRAAIAALERRSKALEAEMALPVPSEETSGQWIIADGNGLPIGKLSVFYYPGANIPPGWRKRIS